MARATVLIGDVKGRESDVLEILELRARELMRAQNGASQARNEGNAFPGGFMLRQVMLARQRLKSNLSWVNAFEALSFALATRGAQENQ